MNISYDPVYRLWNAIKARCTNPKRPNYPYYGARGIKLCQEWSDNPQSFMDWARQNGWKKGLHIDRIDNKGDYCPENCRFVTPRKNNHNRQNIKDKKLPLGVCLHNKKFRARITLKGTLINLGVWDSPDLAGAVFRRAQKMIEEYSLE